MTTIFDHLVPPFEYYSGSQQILDSNKNVVLNLAAWHVLQHVPEGMKLNDEFGQATAYALTSEAYRVEAKARKSLIFKPGCE